MVKIIKFEKNDCAPCRVVDEYFKNAEITIDEKYNPFDNPEMAVKYQVRSVPTTILLSGNDVKLQINGADVTKLNELVNTYKEMINE